MPLIIPLQESVHVDSYEEFEIIKISQAKVDDSDHEIIIQKENLPVLVEYLSELCEKGSGA